MDDQLPLLHGEEAPDGTARLLLRLEDGKAVEAVYMPDPDRRRAALCISTQVGCPVGCTFCASGRFGLDRNLTAAEMVAQVATGRSLLPGSEWRLDRVVFMGMGEPLLNAPAVARTVETLQARWGMGRKRITVSTVGILKGLEFLLALDRPPGLALSLHAATDELRSRLIPFKGAAPVAELMAAARRYAIEARNRVVLQYTLMAGLNDGVDQARRLRDLALPLRRRVKINLIPWNPIPGSPFQRPAPGRIDAFAEVLYTAGLHVTRRQTRGRPVEAACGQLRGRGREPSNPLPENRLL